MAYLKQFSRNRRSKENTKVLTARLPESLYDEFQKYCDSLGISLSEAIYLLVEKEVGSIQNETRSLPEKTNNNDDEHKTNTDEYKINTKTGETNTFSRNDTIKVNSNSGKTNTGNSKKSTKKFVVKPFVIDKKLPCPICDDWYSHSNFSRHADKHKMSTEELFTEYKEKVQEMVKSKSVELNG